MSTQALAPAPPRSEPPAELEPESFAETLYAALEPLAAEDEANGWALLVLCNAIGVMFQQVEELVRDSAEGPGWSLLMDLERCPDDALTWLAQFAGVRVPVGATPAQARAFIASHSNFDRGTPAAIRAAAQATLTGTKTVVFRERDVAGADPPYSLGVITYAAETPDPALTQRAVLSQKPAGIVLSYKTNTGQDWQSLRTNQASWSAVTSRYPTWSDVLTAAPPA